MLICSQIPYCRELMLIKKLLSVTKCFFFLVNDNEESESSDEESEEDEKELSELEIIQQFKVYSKKKKKKKGYNFFNERVKICFSV